MINPVPRWLRVADAAFPIVATISILVAAAGCTPAQRATAGDVLAAAPSLAPVVCGIVAAAGGGTACGPIASDVADVVALVGKILSGWRSSPRAAAPPVVLVIRGVNVTLAPDAAAYVQQQMGATK